MLKTYVLHPGKIRRRTGDIEYFTAQELAELYGVAFEDCLIYLATRRYENTDGIQYIHLRPRDDEFYQI